MGRQADGRVDGMDITLYRLMDRWTDGQIDRWTDKPMDKRTDGWTDERMDGYLEEKHRADGRKSTQTDWCADIWTNRRIQGRSDIGAERWIS